MNIVLIADSYPPEIRSVSLMMQELAEDLVLRGHSVTVVTYWPRYNLSADTKKIKFKELSTENNVMVIRVKTPPHHNVNFMIRGISELISPFLFWMKIKKLIKQRIDAIVVYISPLPLALVGSKVKRKYGSRFLLNIQDIFPQNAIDLGILKNDFLIKFFEYIEKKTYRRADKITTHTENSKNFLIEKKQIPPDKISIVHNWIDTKPYTNAQKTDLFRRKHGLEGKFIFLFAGIIGPAQGLDLIVKVANELREMSEICFLFVGNGSEKETLSRMVDLHGLKNVIFKDFVSIEEYPYLVKSADVGLVCLSKKNRTPVVPGKILGYMAASIPVAAFLNKESDGHVLIKEAECGYSIISDSSVNEVKNLIVKIYYERDTLNRYGENGRRYVLKHFTKSSCINDLIKLI
ncbi:MAG: glycosyltransferase family 4 protein [Sedimentisphaerales bacterium]|nr:glycosyltransferase family 4 protein [Sedimentisphaerales bacterium]